MNTEQLAKELDEQATEALKRQVKAMIVGQGFTMETLAEALNKKYCTKESKANISNKLKRGSLRHIDMLRIADVLGYEIKLIEKPIEGVKKDI